MKIDWVWILFIIIVLIIAFMIYNGGKEHFDNAIKAGELAKKYCENADCKFILGKCVC